MRLNGVFKIQYNSIGKRSVDALAANTTIAIPNVFERNAQNSLEFLKKTLRAHLGGKPRFHF